MWKPTKAGTYRYGDVNREAWLSNDKLMVRDMHTNLWCPVPDGPWSILAPDWQPGAPTVGQLERWQWWAVVTLGGDTIIGSWTMPRYHGKRATDITTHNGRIVDLENITRSAPVQPIPGEVLWVPLEVANGTDH